MSDLGMVLTLVGVALGLVVAVALAWLAVVHNRLARQRNRVQAAWAQVGVHLTRRHALIPDLVITVQGHAAHERATLDEVVAARTDALAAAGAGPVDQARAETHLTDALGRLFALSEAYPSLRANERFVALQAQVASTEDNLSYARQFYQIAFERYRDATSSFPASLVARRMGFDATRYAEAI